MKVRLDELKEKYLRKAIKNRNPLIVQLVDEYKSFKGGRTLQIPTVFCGSKVIDEYIRPMPIPTNDLFN